MTDKERIEKLKKENRRLRRENEYLRYGAELPVGNTKAERMFAEKTRRKRAMGAKTYFGYLLERLRRSRPFRIYDKTRFMMRGFLFARKLFKFLFFLTAALGIGAQVLLTVGAVTVFIPAALVVSLIVGIYGFFTYRKENRRFAEMFSERPDDKIYLFFPMESGDGTAYFDGWVQELAAKNMVFLISDSFWKTGFGGVRKQKNGVYLLHSSYYFSFIGFLPKERLIKIY